MTAPDQTPATDSERDERMQRLAALTVADAGSNEMMALAKDVLRWLDTLAEQAATIERVRAVADQALEDRLVAQEGSPTRLIAYATVDVDDLLAALGSQRTEGQG